MTFLASMILVFLGLIVPSVTAFIFVQLSGSNMLKQDYKEKLGGFFRLNIPNILLSMVIFAAVIFASIALSLLFGE